MRVIEIFLIIHPLSKLKEKNWRRTRGSCVNAQRDHVLRLVRAPLQERKFLLAGANVGGREIRLAEVFSDVARAPIAIGKASAQGAEKLLGGGLATIDPKPPEFLLAGADVGGREIRLAEALTKSAEGKIVSWTGVPHV